VEQTPGFSFLNPQLTDLEEFRRNATWFLVLGVILVILGFIAVGRAVSVTLASMYFFGWLLIIGGVVEAVQAFWQRQWGGLIFHLLSGVLYAVVGFMVLGNPAAGATALTLIIALFFLIAGAFRIIVSLTMRFPEWHWLLLNGAITLLLGLLIWKQWPSSALWVIGLFIGIELIFTGSAWVMLSLAARRFVSQAEVTRDIPG
jgi:uncharacterized membrane protein HdeD (DUF308 family)